ncbi:MAG: PPOX class F420-dependent oxidoreductase [Chloroflexota bacterium]
MSHIPESHHDLLDQPIAVTLGTTMPDNTPQTTVLWFKWDGENILMSTTKGRQKFENLQNNPKVSAMMIDPDNMYRYLEVRGTITFRDEGAFELIDELAKMYTGKDKYYGNLAPAEARQKEERVVLVLTPERVITVG